MLSFQDRLRRWRWPAIFRKSETVSNRSDRPAMTVTITGWNKGFRVKSATQDIRLATGLGLNRSKRLVEDVIAGATVVLQIFDDRAAERCASTLRQHGLTVILNRLTAERT
jgi:hypothetical protein